MDQQVGKIGRVFGRSVKNSSPYASCQVVLGQHSHSLPICVFASVEEICQRGIAAPGLFRVTPPPNERTVEKLTREFDQGPSYGARVSLAKEDTSNICALLKLYLRGLPEAVLSGGLWSIVQKLTLVRTNDAKITSAQVAAIQAILHLQYSTNFSLLVYLLAFMHQLVLHGSQNGLTIPILAGIFGPALFSPRKGNSARTGYVMSPPPESQVLVKTFQSRRDVAEGKRVMTWVLEHWDGIATGLLSLDIVHGSEKDIPVWEANLLKGSLGLFRGGSDGQYSEGPSIDEIVDPALEFPLPEEITVDRVPVRKVRNCLVETAEVPPPHSTRASSPATLWSQETGPNPAMVSRTASLETTKTSLEPAYVQELRRRMDNQETELANLRQELALIRSRFVFPLPPNATLQKIKGITQVDKPEVPNADMDEDTMTTPRPPSGHLCPEFQTMDELIDSLDSKPVTPLFHKTLTSNIPDNGLERGSSNPTSPMDAEQPGETSGSSTTSDSGLDTPPNEPAQGTLCVVNPDPNPEQDVDLSDAGRLQELLTARDALRSALAAMDPVRVQLKVVEEELEHRSENNIP
ncbi:Rho GTPase activation protein [Rhizoctonia solani]|nr:Rho GTPase activation protein [Rhizoctonia solani]